MEEVKVQKPSPGRIVLFVDKLADGSQKAYPAIVCEVHPNIPDKCVLAVFDDCVHGPFKEHNRGETEAGLICLGNIAPEYVIATRSDLPEPFHWHWPPRESEKEPNIMTIEQSKIFEACARAAHEANRAYCIALGDDSQPPWESAPEWQRSSALKGVEGVLLHGNGPEESHRCWLEEKEATGWKYGPKKDPEKKEHPCFVPYARLPPEQRLKDDIFVTTVRTVARALGWTKYPTLLGHV